MCLGSSPHPPHCPRPAVAAPTHCEDDIGSGTLHHAGSPPVGGLLHPHCGCHGNTVCVQQCESTPHDGGIRTQCKQQNSLEGGSWGCSLLSLCSVGHHHKLGTTLALASYLGHFSYPHTQDIHRRNGLDTRLHLHWHRRGTWVDCRFNIRIIFMPFKLSARSEPKHGGHS